MQFGHAFQRLIQRIVYCNPQYGPPVMAKVDLADGYYRIPLSPMAALELAVVLPGDGPYDRLIGIPLSLPMGWSHSPPYFCAYTETITNIANATLSWPSLPHHPLEPELHTPALPLATTFADTAIQPIGHPTWMILWRWHNRHGTPIPCEASYIPWTPFSTILPHPPVAGRSSPNPKLTRETRHGAPPKFS
jgi:hypothetical protein